MRKRRLLIPLGIILLAIILYYFKNQFVVAMVNGRPIFRRTLIKELEKQAGKQALESLITRALILQEAKKQNVVISDDEINQEIKQLEDSLVNQGQSLDQILGARGINRSEVREQIKLQKIVEKIAGEDIDVSDQEVDDYIKENEDLIPEDSDMEEVKANIKQQLKQQKMDEKVQLWIESLRDNAKIHYFL